MKILEDIQFVMFAILMVSYLAFTAVGLYYVAYEFIIHDLFVNIKSQMRKNTEIFKNLLIKPKTK
jgi:hypothetical protein